MTGAVQRNNARVTGTPGQTPVVFAHGFGCDQSMWRLVIPFFEAEHLVVSFDHVGFGRSAADAWDAGKYATLGPYADDLLALLEELGLRDVVFVGHSVAAMIGVLASIKDPSRFAQLVLVGPSPRYIDDPDAGYVGGFSQQDVEDLLEALDANYMGWARQMAPVIMGNSERPALGGELTDSFCRVPTAVAEAFARATFLADNRADLALVTVPTLILQCSDDPIAPEVVGEFVHDRIAGSTMVKLRATGHCPNLSAPAETAAVILEHLAPTAGAAPR